MQKIDRAGLRRWAVTCLNTYPEDSSYRQELDDPEDIAWVAGQLASGNVWAWCEVRVRVEGFGLHAVEYLGQCSYTSEAAFRADGNYDQQVDDAINTLAEQLEAIVEVHDIWEHDRVLCIPCSADRGGEP